MALEFVEKPIGVNGHVVGGDTGCGATHGEGVELEDQPAEATGFLQKVDVAVVQIDVENLLAFVFETLYLCDVIPVEHEVVLYAHIVNLKVVVGDDDYGAVGDGAPQISEGHEPDDVQHDHTANDEYHRQEIFQGDGHNGMVRRGDKEQADVAQSAQQYDERPQNHLPTAKVYLFHR